MKACLKDAQLTEKQRTSCARRRDDAHAEGRRDRAQLIGKSRTNVLIPMKSLPLARPFKAGVLKGDVKDVLLLDVTLLTLAIETVVVRRRR